jgi:microcystin-dependent protein
VAKEIGVKAFENKLAEYLKIVVPPGSVQAFAGTNPPSDWLICDGRTVSRTTYSDLFEAIGTSHGSGDGSTTFNLPDLRGVFLRGLDSGRGLDTGRALGSYQADELKSHNHTESIALNIATVDLDIYKSGNVNSSGRAANIPGISSSNQRRGITDLSGGTEARPKNVAVNYIIKI